MSLPIWSDASFRLSVCLVSQWLNVKCGRRRAIRLSLQSHHDSRNCIIGAEVKARLDVLLMSQAQEIEQNSDARKETRKRIVEWEREMGQQKAEWGKMRKPFTSVVNLLR